MAEQATDRGWENVEDVRARFGGDQRLDPDGMTKLAPREVIELIDFYLRFGNEHGLATRRREEENSAWPDPDQVYQYFEIAKVYLRLAVKDHNPNAREDLAILERGHEVVRGHSVVLAERLAARTEAGLDPKEAMNGTALTRMLPKIPLDLGFTQATQDEIDAVQKLIDLLDELCDALKNELKNARTAEGTSAARFRRPSVGAKPQRPGEERSCRAIEPGIRYEDLTTQDLVDACRWWKKCIGIHYGFQAPAQRPEMSVDELENLHEIVCEVAWRHGEKRERLLCRLRKACRWQTEPPRHKTNIEIYARNVVAWAHDAIDDLICTLKTEISQPRLEPAERLQDRSSDFDETKATDPSDHTKSGAGMDDTQQDPEEESGTGGTSETWDPLLLALGGEGRLALLSFPAHMRADARILRV